MKLLLFTYKNYKFFHLITHGVVIIKSRTNKLLGSTLKLKRLAKGISQEELCESINSKNKVKMNQSHLSNIESGKSIPLLETFSLIISALNVDWNDVKNVYINAQKDLNVLLLVLQKCYQNQDHLSAKKTLNRLFWLTNKKAGKSRRKVLVKSLFLILFYESRRSVGTSRMNATILKFFQEGTRNEVLQLLEDLYQFSIEKKQFQTFNCLVESIVGVVDSDREGCFKLHFQYATGLFYEKKFADALLVAHRSYQLMQKTSHTEEEYQLLARLSEIYLKLKMYDKAQQLLSQATVIFENSPLEYDFPREKVLHMRNLALLSIMNGDLKKAFEKLIKSINLLEGTTYLNEDPITATPMFHQVRGTAVRRL